MTTSRRRRRTRAIASALLLLVGVALVLYPLVGNLLYQMTARSAIDAYDASVSRLSQDELDALWDEARAYNDELVTPVIHDPWDGNEDAPPLDRYWETLDPDGTGLMGYVEVEAAGIMLPVYHGLSDEVLETGVGHLPTTALPIGGEGTHAVVTAHTGLPDKMLFTNLSVVDVGDVFSMHVLGHELRYEVTSVDIVEPDDVSLLMPVEGLDRMTLLTCTPYGVNSHRLLVTGMPTEAEVSNATTPPLWLLLFPIFALFLLVIALIVALWLRRRAVRQLREDEAEGVPDEGLCARDRRDVRLCTAFVAVTAVLLVVSAWLSLGVAMRVGLVPYFDLGYTWFDATVFDLYGF